MKRLVMMAAVVVMLVAQMASPLSAANTTPPLYPLTLKDSVVSVTRDWNYTMTSATPFGDNGYVDLVNTEHAVLILTKVKPSAALKLLSHVRINGVAAKEGTNCQVKLYNRGTIILPYTDKDVLTVYDGQNFEGTAVSDFGMGNTGGFMNTLTEKQLNNKIRSFRLKRGYMVTFSTLPGGRGYSRCFIAANADLEVKTLPAVLDGHISSYRLFRWYDTGKQQLAAATGDVAACSALNVTSTYTWGKGASMLPDVESVVHHIKENWPTAAELGTATWTPHMKTNNEPRNSADDSPCDLNDILANWQDLMATGMRLCSPSSWDGSDYWNGAGFLKQFFDSIDARGWRCDIIDLHGYWTEGAFNTNIPNWHNAVKRPVWVSEWCWGASWNDNGAFASGATEAKLKTALQTICTTMNNQPYVERYFYWNGERDPSKLYKNGKLTPGGEYYATIDAGVGYNAAYEYVPKVSAQKAAADVKVVYDKTARTAKLSWYDSNGEYNRSMTVERSDDGGKTWKALQTVAQRESPSAYTYEDQENVYDGVAYRVLIVDMYGMERRSAVVTTQIEDIEAGEALTIDGKTLYVGGNLLKNGDFYYGTQGWTNGVGSTIGQPYFQVVPVGGPDGGGYLQCYGNGAIGDASALRTYVAIEPDTYYFFRCASLNGGSHMTVNVSPDNKSVGTQALTLNGSSEWKTQYKTFNSGNNAYAVIAFSTLGNNAQFDKMELCRMFATADEARADADALRPTAADSLAVQTKAAREVLDSLLTIADVVLTMDVYKRDALATLVATARSAADNGKAPADLVALGEELRQTLTPYLPTAAAEKQPQSPAFAGTQGWTVKAGTYQGGDQRTNIVGGLTCWNAWWSGINAAEGKAKTMEVNQTVSKLPAGLYALQCQATTEHYCLSDQHGFITDGNVTAVTPALSHDYFDLPVDNIWQTLTTTPIYVPEDGSLTLGFKSSKQGAVDNAWRRIGGGNSDKREGWWCATDFRLLYRPVVKLSVQGGRWATLCLPYTTAIPQGMSCYRVAGILSDHSAICLQPVEAIEAGRPVIYTAASDATPMLYTYGDAASAVSPAENEQNLIGTFDEKLVRSAHYLLVDGQWKYFEERDFVPANNAYFRTFDNMTEYATWDGLTLPVAETTGIGSLKAGAAGTAAAYTLGGRPATGARGVVIERNGKTTRKVVR